MLLKVSQPCYSAFKCNNRDVRRRGARLPASREGFKALQTVKSTQLLLALTISRLAESKCSLLCQPTRAQPRDGGVSSAGLCTSQVSVGDTKIL